MTWWEFFGLAVLSIFWPLLIAIVVVALRLPNTVKLLAAFLAGGLLTTIAVGLAIVSAFSNSSLSSSSRSTADPVIYIVIGALALIGAYVLRGMKPKQKKPAKEPGRWSPDNVLQSARLAFLAGIVLNVAPGVFPFIALKDIAEGSFSTGENVLLVTVFYLIMFATVEVPILAYVVSPARTESGVKRVNEWLDRNGRSVGIWALAGGGCFFIVRGLLQL